MSVRSFMPTLAVALLSLLFLSPLSAQNGWDDIADNDNRAARAAFESQLEKDSTNQNALIGLIYLDEVEENRLDYLKRINTLIRNHWDEDHFVLFEHIMDIDREKVMKQNFSPQAQIANHITWSAKKFYEREFDLYKKEANRHIPDLNFYIAGPFKSISGYGYVREFSVEKEPFNPEKEFDEETEHPMTWHKRELRNPMGIVNFKDHLNSAADPVYYANTFLTFPEDQTIQLRIARNTPMKIWMDGKLVFENNEMISLGWDNEIVELKVTKGTHRLLVKQADLPTEGGSGLFYWYDKDYGYVSYDYGSYIYGALSSNVQFGLRITDTQGNALKNYTSDYTGKAGTPPADVSEKNNFISDRFKKRLEKDPGSLAAQYLYERALLKDGLRDKAEEYTYLRWKADPDLFFNQFMAAKVLFSNDKSEKAYSIISNADEEKTPAFALIEERMEELEENTDDREIEELLAQLKSITPSHSSVIRGYIDFYQRKGMDKERKKYVQEIIDTYPELADYYEGYLEDENYRPDEYKAKTDKERAKEAKEAAKAIKTNFDPSDYNTLISYYKNKDKADKVYELYDELLEHMRFSARYMGNKAKYYYTNEEYDKATAWYKKSLAVAPYDDDTWESLGDIAYDTDKMDEALEYYRAAKKYGAGYSSYYGSDIDDKIHKIEEPENTKELVDTKSFNDLMENDVWKDKYTGEDAVVVMYTRDLIYNKEEEINLYQKTMIKILTEAGASNWTEADYSYFGTLTKVKQIKPDGAEVTPDHRNGYIVFKNLKAGDIIQIEGSATYSTGGDLGKSLFVMNYLSSQYPTYYLSMNVLVPEGMELNYLSHKVPDSVVTKVENGYQYYAWEFTDFPKNEREDAQVDVADVYASVMLSTIKDWDVIIDWYTQKTYRRLEPNYEIRAMVDSLITPGMSDEEKVVALYNHLTEEIQYSYVPFLQSNYIPKKAGMTCSNKIGDCKDVATLMITALNEVGIDAWYVLVKTSNFHRLEILPSIMFDHVIVGYELPGEEMRYLDMTSDYYPHYAMHGGNSESYALVIRPGEELFQLPSDYLNPEYNRLDLTIDAELKDDRNAKVEVQSIAKGASSGYLREVINTLSEEEKKQFIQEFYGSGVFDNKVIKKQELGDITAITAPLESRFEFEAPNYADKVGSMMIFQVPYMKAVQSSGAVNADKRYNRIDVEQMVDVDPVYQTVNIQFPPGYSLVEMPKSHKVSSPFGKYSVEYKRIPGGLQVKKEQVWNQRVIELEEYEAFKKYYLEILDLDNAKLSIKK